MKEPIFSVIIPAYNAEKFIARCVCSVCTEKDTEGYEIIVTDDGSTDGTWDILDRFAKEKTNMSVVHSENKGVSHARNEALRRAEGKYIIFLDADDYLLDGWYATALSGVKEDCDFAVFDFIKKYEDGTEDKVAYELMNGETDVCERLALTSNLMNPCWSRIYRRSILKTNNIRFDEAVSMGEDFLFTLEYIKYCKSIVVIHMPFLYKEERMGSVMHRMNVQKYLEDDSRVLVARLQYMQEHPNTNNCIEDCYLLHFRAITNLLLQSANCNGEGKERIRQIIENHHTGRIIDNVNHKELPLLKRMEYLLINNRYKNVLYIYFKIKAKLLFMKKNNS